MNHLSLIAQAAPPDIRLFVELDNTLSRVLDAFVEPTASSLMGGLQTIALLGATIYVLVIGFTILFGADSTPVYTFFRKSFKIILVTGLALSADGYLGGIVQAMKDLENGLVNTLANGTTSQSSGGVAQALDNVLKIGFILASACMQQAEQAGVLSPGASFGWLLTAAVLGFATVILTLAGGAVFFLSKFALAILFAIGPLFVLCLMFPQTASFFDKWMAQVLSFVFQNVIISAILMLAVDTFVRFLIGFPAQGLAGPNPFIASLQIATVSAVFTYLMFRAGPLAAGLSGGVASSVVDARHAAMGTAKAAILGAKASALAGSGGALLSGGLASVGSMLGAKAGSFAGRLSSPKSLPPPVGSITPGTPEPSSAAQASSAAIGVGSLHARSTVSLGGASSAGAAPPPTVGRAGEVPQQAGAVVPVTAASVGEIRPISGGAPTTSVSPAASPSPGREGQKGDPSTPKGLSGNSRRPGGVQEQRLAAMASFAQRTERRTPNASWGKSRVAGAINPTARK